LRPLFFEAMLVGKPQPPNELIMPRLLTLLAAMLFSGAAQAHTGVGDTNGFLHGFAHPISGVDHVLAMVAVGLFGTRLGGRALWLVPLSFVSMMVVGGALGMTGVELPFVEIGIGLSVVVFGISVAAHFDLPTVAAMTMVGFFALFHGHAHGAEMPQSASGLEYGTGFVLATAMLHAFGIGLGLLIARVSQAYGRRILQTAGAAMAVTGVAILAGYV
jgi:urease accessory protein